MAAYQAASTGSMRRADAVSRAVIPAKPDTAQRREVPRVCGEGWRQIVLGGPSMRCFFVASRTTAGLEYSVFVRANGELVCSCISAHYRGICVHKTAVARVLAEEAEAIARRQAQADEEAERGWVLTARGRRALEQWRKEQEEAAREITAPSATPTTNDMRGVAARRAPSDTSAPTNADAEAMLRREPFSFWK